MNTCYNAVDRHVEKGRGEKAAIVYESPVTQTRKEISYGQLLKEVNEVADGLVGMGVVPGDRVVIYMPGIPEAMVSMLAAARIGAVHSVVFGGFSSPELAKRISHARPKVLLTASEGYEGLESVIPYKPLVDAALDRLPKEDAPDFVVVKDRNRVGSVSESLHASMVEGRDYEWDAAWATFGSSSHTTPCVALPASHPLYVLYTSGTTGEPKGIVRDHGGHAVALLDSLKTVYNQRVEDVWWAASDLGWVVGSSYIAYAPLLHGQTSVLFEGKPILGEASDVFWDIIARNKVHTLFTAPTALRAIRAADPQGTALGSHLPNMDSFSALFLAGERTDPTTSDWVHTHVGVPCVDHWWQTELGWPALAGCAGLVDSGEGAAGLDLVPGSASRPVPGYDVRVLHDSATAGKLDGSYDGVVGEEEEHPEAEVGEIGALAIKLPLPPGTMTGLWRDEGDGRLSGSYLERFPGYYETGDAAFVDESGCFHVMARVDDVINVAAHRLSTGEAEEVLMTHSCVAKAAVVGAADELKGQVPVAFVVLNPGAEGEVEEVKAELKSLIRSEISPIASLRDVYVVKAIPETRSAKYLRATIRFLVDNGCDADVPMPSTIADPAAVEYVREALRAPSEASEASAASAPSEAR